MSRSRQRILILLLLLANAALVASNAFGSASRREQSAGNLEDAPTPSWQSRIPALLQQGYRAFIDTSDVLEVEKDRTHMDAVARMFKPPSSVRWSPVSANSLPAEWTLPKGPSPDGVVHYFHGGAFYTGSIQRTRASAGNVAAAGNSRVLVIDYRLAPEHPFPAALEDARAAYGPRGRIRLRELRHWFRGAL